MKKIAALLLAFVTLFSLYACNVAPMPETEESGTLSDLMTGIEIEIPSDLAIELPTEFGTELPTEEPAPEPPAKTFPAVLGRGDFYKIEQLSEYRYRYTFYDRDGNETLVEEDSRRYYLSELSNEMVYLQCSTGSKFYDIKNKRLSEQYFDFETFTTDGLIFYLDGPWNHRVLVVKNLFDDSLYYREYDLGLETNKDPIKDINISDNKLFLCYYEKGVAEPKFTVISLFEEKGCYFTDYASIIRLADAMGYTLGYLKENVDWSKYFRLSNQEEQELFDKLLQSQESIGGFSQYAVKDLNNDGVFELILLHGYYKILAIFTTVDGKPQLVDHYWEEKQGFLDQRGLIYTVDRSEEKTRVFRVDRLLAGGVAVENQLCVKTELIESMPPIPHNRYYRFVNGEWSLILPEEYDEMIGKYSYPGYHTTRDCARIAFNALSYSLDAAQAFSKNLLRSALKDELLVLVAQTGEFCHLSDYQVPTTGKALSEIEGLRYSFVDLDGDSVCEVVIDCGVLLSLRYENGRVVLTQAELSKPLADQPAFSPLTLPWEAKISPEEAIAIADQYFGGVDGDEDAACGTRYTIRLVLREEPDDGIGYYRVAVQRERRKTFGDAEGWSDCYDVEFSSEELLVNMMTGQYTFSTGRYGLGK